MVNRPPAWKLTQTGKVILLTPFYYSGELFFVCNKVPTKEQSKQVARLGIASGFKPHLTRLVGPNSRKCRTTNPKADFIKVKNIPLLDPHCIKY